jgi:two-component system cell cycle response regulator
MKRILLANQNRVTLELIKVYLMVKDVVVYDAGTGLEALGLARAERPDLILCDLNLPGLDGPALCRMLQADPKLRDIPVIMMIGARDPESLRRCQEAGARAILTRPIRPQQLQEAVERHTGIDLGLAAAPAMTPAPVLGPAEPLPAQGFAVTPPRPDATGTSWSWSSRSKAS